MISKCPHCSVLLESPHKPGVSVVCDHCEKKFSAYPFLGDDFVEQAPSRKTFDKTEAGIGTGLLFTFILGQKLAKEFPDSLALNLFDSAITGLTFGTLVGYVPLFVARGRGRTKLGMMALVACAISGTLLGLIGSGSMAIVFTIVALTQKKIPRQYTAESTDKQDESESAPSEAQENTQEEHANRLHLTHHKWRDGE